MLQVRPGGLLSFDDIAAAMQGAGEACGLEPKAVYATIRSAWNGGQRKDRSHELPDFLFEEPGEDNGTYADGLEAPESLTDIATPWLPRTRQRPGPGWIPTAGCR